MERLTQWVDDGDSKKAIPRVDIRNNGHNKCCNKLAEYEELEEQGLLVRLPCKVGTEVFCFFPGDSHYTKCQIKKIEICPSIFGNICYFAEPVGKRGCCCRYFDNEFGKFLFLTLEEAEKKLEEMRNV